ncbi:hypothetical protein PLICRDRAFT_37097 [Plicaturopsis crispa FD-325 SS-3]|nr:hypothetical protein PLICRDRAFT_37097 [Plicaturopsis crispa FD-325 SS-3]
MIRRFLPRLPLFRTLAPRITPILPIARLSARQSPLTGGSRSSQTRLFTHFSARLSSSPPPSPSSQDTQLPPNASLSQKLKHLIKSYGWYALGVYIILSALDFGVAFAGINLLGAEYVSRVAASAKELVADYLPSRPPEPGREEVESASSRSGSSQEGLYAMLVLAYTIHKTLFLPVRVGLTAGLTPKLVKWLRARGWAGGEGTRRATHEIRERIRNKGRD